MRQDSIMLYQLGDSAHAGLHELTYDQKSSFCFSATITPQLCKHCFDQKLCSEQCPRRSV